MSGAIKPVRVLIVPGHDNEVWGAQYGYVKEADMNLALATRLYNILKKDKRFKVYITRDNLGYTTEFANYFANMDSITTFKEDAQKDRQEEIASGDFVVKEGAPHASAGKDVALKLYGFNKWANENNIDAIIHIHFNDYFRSNKWEVGKYKGFTVYMPEAQMANAKTSDILAKYIFSELKKKYTPSNFPKESGGLASDQQLIALGASGTLDSSVRSVLIEYGYIYEKKFRTYTLRKKAYTTMAQLTATAMKKYFFGK